MLKKHSITSVYSKAAFDTARRDLVLRILPYVGVLRNVLTLLVPILQEKVSIDYRVVDLLSFFQTIGLT